MWEYVISGGALIVVALIEAVAARGRKHAKEEREKAAADRARSEGRAVDRARESLLSMELVVANCKLTRVTAKAVTGQRTNGDVKEAMDAHDVALIRYECYLREIAARHTSKG